MDFSHVGILNLISLQELSLNIDVNILRLLHNKIYARFSRSFFLFTIIIQF